jgi:hypothetical protein
MRRHWIILLGIIAWAILVITSGALAHALHTSQVAAQSPFDAPKVKKSLHCMLHGHHHKMQPFCPHTMRDRNTQTLFKADCGDSHSGTLIKTQWSKLFILLPSTRKTSSPIKKYFSIPKRFRLPSPLPDLIEKPPQHA